MENLRKKLLPKFFDLLQILRKNGELMFCLANMGHTCRLRKFVLQKFHSDSPSEEARRQLENALCIVRKSELSVMALVEVWVSTQ